MYDSKYRVTGSWQTDGLSLSLWTMLQHFTWFFLSLDQPEMFNPLTSDNTALYFILFLTLAYYSFLSFSQRIMMMFFVFHFLSHDRFEEHPYVLFWRSHPAALNG